MLARVDGHVATEIDRIPYREPRAAVQEGRVSNGAVLTNGDKLRSIELRTPVNARALRECDSGASIDRVANAMGGEQPYVGQQAETEVRPYATPPAVSRNRGFGSELLDDGSHPGHEVSSPTGMPPSAHPTSRLYRLPAEAEPMSASSRSAPEGADVVVVLSYNGREDTEECIQSLVAGSPDAHVLVIDNGSFDGVLDAVRRRWPHLETLQTGTNLGFAGGMNAGIRWALQTGARTITVLNNDTIIPRGTIAACVKVALDGGIAVSPEVRYADGTERVWFGGGVIDRQTNLARHLSEQEIMERYGARPDSLRSVHVLAGCCITANTDTWRRVGLFDERYFLNFEDSDWSVRAERSGVRLVVDPRVFIYHKVSASFRGAYSYLGGYYYARNGLLFGSSLRAWAVPTRLRFLRRHVLPVLAGAIRRREWKESGRQALVILAAVSSHLGRRYGRASRHLEACASAWSRSH